VILKFLESKKTVNKMFRAAIFALSASIVVSQVSTWKFLSQKNNLQFFVTMTLRSASR